MMHTVVAQLHTVTKRFGEVCAVNQLTLSLPQGEVIGLLGPNGAGKTTTIRLILGFESPDAGHVLVNGIDPTRHPQRVRAFTGYVMQQSGLDQYLTGRENALVYAALCNVPRSLRQQRVQELFEWVGIDQAADRLAKTYSGGMLRRLDIVMSLLHHPSLLILDEPTLGLDIQSRRQIWELIRKLKHQGTTVLITTHYLEEARLLCDRVAVINGGVLVADDTPEHLMTQFAHEAYNLTVAFTSAPSLEHLDLPLSPQCDTPGVLVFRGAAPLVWQTLSTIHQRFGEQIQSIAFAQPSLDDVFLQLTETQQLQDTKQMEGG